MRTTAGTTPASQKTPMTMYKAPMTIWPTPATVAPTVGANNRDPRYQPLHKCMEREYKTESLNYTDFDQKHLKIWELQAHTGFQSKYETEIFNRPCSEIRRSNGTQDETEHLESHCKKKPHESQWAVLSVCVRVCVKHVCVVYNGINSQTSMYLTKMK